MNTEFKRILVWSSWFRLSHLFIGVSSIILLATGTLISESPLMASIAIDIHYYAASLLTIGLVIRIYLMFFGQANERVTNLIPKASELRTIGEMFRFYILLGKAPLPRWYAQNPFWKPIYLIFYCLLISQVLSGFLIAQGILILGFYPPTIHYFLANILLVFTVLHIIVSIWHDYKGGGSDVSAMINGIRTFTIDRPSSASNNQQPVKFTPFKSKNPR